MAETVWTRDLKVGPAGKETLVIHCSDWRFVDATHEFLKEPLKIAGYDLIAVPGAIHFVVSHLFPKYSWVARHWLKFLMKHHGTKRVIAFSHADCGWYKFMHAVELWSEKLLATQAEDAKRAGAVFSEVSGGVSYEHYFVNFTDDKVAISKVV